MPLLAEAGVPGFEFGTWAGIVGPAALPKPIIDKLNAGFIRALSSPGVRGRYAEQGILASHYGRSSSDSTARVSAAPGWRRMYSD